MQSQFSNNKMFCLIIASSVDPSVVEALATSGPQETISSDFVGSQSSANVKANELLESDQSTQSTTTTGKKMTDR